MFDDLAALLPLFLFLGGYAIYALIGRWMRHQQALAAAKMPPKPICGCGHSLAFHPPQGGCAHQETQPVAWETRRVDSDHADTYPDADIIGHDYDPDPDDIGDQVEVIVVRVPTDWAPTRCGCVRYVGPEPLITLAAPELSDSAVEDGHRILPPVAPKEER